MAKGKRRRAPNDGGSIDQRPSGRWRLRVRVDDRQVAYGTYETEDEAVRAQARWRVTHLLPADDPQLTPEVPISVLVDGVRCDEWFVRWQEAKSARRSKVRVGGARGGSESTRARDRAQWSKWWSPAIGDRLPQTLTMEDIAGVLRTMESVGRAPNTIRTHWLMIRAMFNWLVAEGILTVSPVKGLHVTVDPAQDRVREIVVPDFRFLDVLTSRLPTAEDRSPAHGRGPVDLRAVARDRWTPVGGGRHPHRGRGSGRQPGVDPPAGCRGGGPTRAQRGAEGWPLEGGHRGAAVGWAAEGAPRQPAVRRRGRGPDHGGTR